MAKEVDAKKKVIEALLPPGMDVKRLKAMIWTSMQRNSRLADCSIPSILGCAYEAAKLGLDLDSGAQLAHMVPYKGQAQFQLGFRGMLVLARRSLGSGTALGAVEVRANDDFHHVDFPPDLKHSVPRVNGMPMSEKDRGQIIASYAWVRFQDGYLQYRVCYLDELRRARAASKAKNGPWVLHEAAMAQKTALKRLCKVLPMPDAAGRAMMLDDSADDGREQSMGSEWKIATGEDEASPNDDDVITVTQEQPSDSQPEGAPQ